MKRPNITPGLWATNLDKTTAADVWVEQPSGIRRFVACCPQGAKGQRQQTQEQWSEDARSISALPDLLEALEKLHRLASLQLNQGASMDGLTNCDALAAARAALTKAGYEF